MALDDCPAFVGMVIVISIFVLAGVVIYLSRKKNQKREEESDSDWLDRQW